mgnify:CR=1 FL=1
MKMSKRVEIYGKNCYYYNPHIVRKEAFTFMRARRGIHAKSRTHAEQNRILQKEQRNHGKAHKQAC